MDIVPVFQFLELKKVQTEVENLPNTSPIVSRLLLLKGCLML